MLLRGRCVVGQPRNDLAWKITVLLVGAAALLSPLVRRLTHCSLVLLLGQGGRAKKRAKGLFESEQQALPPSCEWQDSEQFLNSLRRARRRKAGLRCVWWAHHPPGISSLGCAWSTLCLDTTNAGFGAGQEKGPLSAPNERLGNHFWSTRGKGKGQ